MPAVHEESAYSTATSSLRAEQALKLLRQRMERHEDQEVRLGRLYQGWQDGWSAQCDRLQELMGRLEAHLATWLRHTEPAPVFSVVRVHEGE